MTQSDKKALEEFEKYMNEHKCFDSYAIETGKSFILKTRQEARDEERQRIVEIAEGMKRVCEWCKEKEECEHYYPFYNQALADFITALTEQK